MYSTYSQLWKFKNSVFKCQKIRRYVLLIVEKRIKHTYLAVNDVGLRHDKENCVQVLDTRRKQLVDLLFQFVTDESYKNVGGTQSAITHFTRTIFRNFFNCKVQKFTARCHHLVLIQTFELFALTFDFDDSYNLWGRLPNTDLALIVLQIV